MSFLFQFLSLLLVFFGCIFILVPQQVIYLISSLTTSEHSQVQLLNICLSQFFFEKAIQVVMGNTNIVLLNKKITKNYRFKFFFHVSTLLVLNLAQCKEIKCLKYTIFLYCKTFQNLFKVLSLIQTNQVIAFHQVQDIILLSIMLAQFSCQF